MTVAIIAHGIGMNTAISGEGRVYQTFFDMLKARSVEYVAVSFSKPKWNVPATYFLPFSLSRFDKYQRILTYLPARRLRPDLFLNASGVPIPLSDIAPHVIYAGGPSVASIPSKYTKSLLWRLYLLPFKAIVSRLRDEARKAEFVANSRYSARAISQVYSIPEPKVVYPGVDVEFFSRAFSEEKGKRQFLTIARIERGKMIENAIRLSAISGVKGIVVGSLLERDYYESLRRLAKREGADVEILTNAPGETILEIMKDTPVYFHPTLGEHFGSPVAEAMCAGLVPVVPRESGASELVPEFTYGSLEEARDRLIEAMKVSGNVRREMFSRVKDLRREVFQERMFEIISKYLKR